MITGAQIRAARSLLGISSTELAQRSNLTRKGVEDIERGNTTPRESTINNITRALYEEGIEFLPDEGLKRRYGTIDRLTGVDALANFFEDVYETVKGGGELRVSGVDERKFAQFNTEENAKMHRERMAKIKDNILFRVLLKEGDTYFRNNTYIQYRWMPKEFFFPHPIYLYNEKLAFIKFENNNLEILRISMPLMAAAFRSQFDFIWQHSMPPKADGAQ